MCGTVEHVSISACADDFNLLGDSVNTAILYKKNTDPVLFDCKETGTEKETEAKQVLSEC